MGYTHYYSNSGTISHGKWQAFINDFVTLKDACKDDFEVQYEYDNPSQLLFDGESIQFNGVGRDGHETFVFKRTKFSDFCKTARKPYDILVTACLLSALHHFPKIVHVSSDGDRKDWRDGIKLVERVFGPTYLVKACSSSGCRVAGLNIFKKGA